jgi:3-oxoacyl-[acyl-carrier protein] reductase
MDASRIPQDKANARSGAAVGGVADAPAFDQADHTSRRRECRMTVETARQTTPRRAALICGASKGLGFASAMALARAGRDVTITARSAGPLEDAARAIRAETGVAVTAVAGDITTEAGRRAALAACPAPDILVTNAGGPPAGDFRDWDRETWIAALDANMLTPIFLIRAVVDGMIERRFGRIVNITSGSVKSPIPTLGLSNGARAGLTGFVAGLSRQVARHNVTINNLLPGAFLTDRLRGLSATAAQKAGRTTEEELAARAGTIPAGRIGDPAEFGAACAFLCADAAGFIVGQNLLIDGGAFQATMG